MPRLVPYLRDKEVYGYAVNAMAKAGGVEAVPLLMQELEKGNDVGGMIYQHLNRLTGEDFADKKQPWLDWWQNQNQRNIPNAE